MNRIIFLFEGWGEVLDRENEKLTEMTRILFQSLQSLKNSEPPVSKILKSTIDDVVYVDKIWSKQINKDQQG